MTHTPTTPTTPADISTTSSPEPAVCGDRGGIQGGSVEKMQKTGVFSVTEQIFEREDSRLHNRAVLRMKKRLRHALNDRIAACLWDGLGREYSVKIHWFSETQNKRDKTVEITMSATVLLVHAADCEIGECCLDVNAYLIQNSTMCFWRDEQPDNVFVSGAKHFRRSEDGSGWRRIQ